MNKFESWKDGHRVANSDQWNERRQGLTRPMRGDPGSHVTQAGSERRQQAVAGRGGVKAVRRGATMRRTSYNIRQDLQTQLHSRCQLVDCVTAQEHVIIYTPRHVTLESVSSARLIQATSDSPAGDWTWKSGSECPS
ncbi:hypothetical protein J6590_040006 [Homalodisca vitripennis]|nr:hypothetical protein J6590_040006 [Homalodisca vitripennis]